LSGASLCCLGQNDIEHPILETRHHPARVNTGRQRDDAPEAAALAFATVVVDAFAGFGELSLTSDRQRIPFDVDLDIIRFNSGQLRAHVELVMVLADIQRREDSRAVIGDCPAGEISEQTIHFLFPLIH